MHHADVSLNHLTGWSEHRVAPSPFHGAAVEALFVCSSSFTNLDATRKMAPIIVSVRPRKNGT